MITRIAATFLRSERGGFHLHRDKLSIFPSHKIHCVLLGHRYLPTILFEDDRRCQIFADQASSGGQIIASPSATLPKV